MSDKELISKIYIELINCKNQKKKQPDFKMDKGSEQTFFLRRHRDGQ